MTEGLPPTGRARFVFNGGVNFHNGYRLGYLGNFIGTPQAFFSRHVLRFGRAPWEGIGEVFVTDKGASKVSFGARFTEVGKFPLLDYGWVDLLASNETAGFVFFGGKNLPRGARLEALMNLRFPRGDRFFELYGYTPPFLKTKHTTWAVYAGGEFPKFPSPRNRVFLGGIEVQLHK